MKPIELTPAWFGQCPRYLSAKRFSDMAGLKGQENQIENLVKQGVLPTRQLGRHLMIDMHRLMLMLPSDTSNEAFLGQERPTLTPRANPSHALATLFTKQQSVLSD
ncbi:hypothetical protein [Pseudomonas turukhanskensis]|uniref:Uncharacterized protein n=1 Tax=Pseudomonas turukhanskensis TaxID=1806536 RepID=A0A9W6K6B4_9PSED|nr:hypothetical protein [Pseudomonas turukhanskensis]GLK88799.1 hypothetical protein GCM10017655_18610 [Pseudomonas turukhanskensis]